MTVTFVDVTDCLEAGVSGEESKESRGDPRKCERTSFPGDNEDEGEQCTWLVLLLFDSPPALALKLFSQSLDEILKIANLPSKTMRVMKTTMQHTEHIKTWDNREEMPAYSTIGHN